MSDHDHPHHDHPEPTPVESHVDTGSQALDEALRSSFVIVKVVLVVLVIVFIFSGVRAVGPQERAVILRFGKPVGTGPEQLLKPGFHWAFPYPIDEIVKIRIGEIQTVTSSVGWFNQTAEQEVAGAEPPALPSLNPSAEGYALTSDANIVHVRATMRYRISDLLAYEFDFKNTQDIVQNILNNALVYAASHSTVDYALLNNAGFNEKIVARLNQQIAERKLGITLEPVDVRVVAPKYVKESFDQVLAAEQDRSRAINQAQANASSTNSGAQALAKRMVFEAESETTRLIRKISTEANFFTSHLSQYQTNRNLLMSRLLTETLARVLTNEPDKKFAFPPDLNGKPYELRLNLNREPRNPKAAESQP